MKPPRNAGGEEQTEILTTPTLDQEKFGHHSHQEAADDVHEERAIGKGRPQIGERRSADSVSNGCPNPSANKNDQITATHAKIVALSRTDRNRRKICLRLVRALGASLASGYRSWQQG